MVASSVPVTEMISAFTALSPIQSEFAISFFPFKGHLSLCVCAKFHLALEAPSQGRGDGERGGMSLGGITSHDAERLQAGCSSCLQRQHPGQTDPAQPSTSPEVSFRSFPISTHSMVGAAFPSPPILPHTSRCSWHASVLKMRFWVRAL